MAIQDKTVKYTTLTKTAITLVEDTIDNTTTSLVLPYQDNININRIVNNNLIHLVENFCSNTAPSPPVEGQLWLDTSDPDNKQELGRLKIYMHQDTGMKFMDVAGTVMDKFGNLRHIGHIEAFNDLNNIPKNVNEFPDDPDYYKFLTTKAHCDSNYLSGYYSTDNTEFFIRGNRPVTYTKELIYDAPFKAKDSRTLVQKKFADMYYLFGVINSNTTFNITNDKKLYYDNSIEMTQDFQLITKTKCDDKFAETISKVTNLSSSIKGVADKIKKIANDPLDTTDLANSGAIALANEVKRLVAARPKPQNPTPATLCGNTGVITISPPVTTSFTTVPPTADDYYTYTVPADVNSIDVVATGGGGGGGGSSGTVADQKWYIETNNKKTATIYTNNSEFPICISVDDGIITNNGLILYCDGAVLGQSVISAGNCTAQITDVIPVGSTYKVTRYGSETSVSAIRWREIPLDFIGSSAPVTQKWRNEGANRQTATVYTNSTNFPIYISVDDGNITNNGLILYCDGEVIGQNAISAGNSTAQLSAVIPAGSTYKVTRFGTETTVSNIRWRELTLDFVGSTTSTQKWRNEGANRKTATEYTNSTGSVVCISVDDGNIANNGLILYCDGNVLGQNVLSVSDCTSQITGIIPAGSKYKVTRFGTETAVSTIRWHELTLDFVGSGGAGGNGGNGDVITASSIPVTPGEVLRVYVGAGGAGGNTSYNTAGVSKGRQQPSIGLGKLPSLMNLTTLLSATLVSGPAIVKYTYMNAKRGPFLQSQCYWDVNLATPPNNTTKIWEWDIVFPRAGQYIATIAGSDSCYLYVDGTKIVTNESMFDLSFQMTLTKGTHRVKVEGRNINGGTACVAVDISELSTGLNHGGKGGQITVPGVGAGGSGGGSSAVVRDTTGEVLIVAAGGGGGGGGDRNHAGYDATILASFANDASGDTTQRGNGGGGGGGYLMTGGTNTGNGKGGDASSTTGMEGGKGGNKGSSYVITGSTYTASTASNGGAPSTNTVVGDGGMGAVSITTVVTVPAGT